MLSIQRALVLLTTAGAIALPTMSRNPAGRLGPDGRPDPKQIYNKSQSEYYLTSDEYSYIRPGLKVTVESVEIPADRRPVVVLSFTDDLDQPLDRAGVITPGAVSFSYIMSWYNGDARDYHAYTTRPQTSPITGDTANQASADSGGTTEDLSMGRLRYRFKTVLPVDYDASKTTTLGIYATRNLTEIAGKNYYANVEHDFRPDGGEVTEVWDEIADATCNSCHEQLAFHGGSRREVKLCVLCHNSGSVDPDTGNTVDFKVMIHKIHMGENLPSVQAGTPYEIIGYNQSVNDYSDVVFPQDVRNCARCHGVDAPQSHVWYDEPSRAACGSCHDNIDWTNADVHPIPQLSDAICARCHTPQGDREFDISIMGAHTIPTKSKQLAGLKSEILDVTGAVPGGTPTVTFKITNGDGSPVAPSSLDRLNIVVAGPTTDYTKEVSESATGATVSGDAAVYTFSEPLPADAEGTFAFSMDAYRFVTIDNGTDEGLEVREAAFNPIYYAAVTDSAPVPRREVVDLAKCNVCHDVLALHGGQRYNVTECVMCHQPGATDEETRPADKNPPQSIHFKWMIHRIHTGEDLTSDFTIYGYRGSVNNFNDVRFPGDRRTCVTCHIPGTYSVPVTPDALPTLTERDYYSPMLPAAAACLSCHSTLDAASHAYVNTAPFGESCGACHGDNREFSVDQVHAH